MNYNITITTSSDFIESLKVLVKKYPSLPNDLLELQNSLLENPVQGVSLGKNCYKIRLKIASKGKGKSGGGRIITYVWLTKGSVTLLEIFDKSDKESITDKELAKLIKNAG
jgi:hypothetical protein